MAIAQDAAAPREHGRRWTADNPIVRAVGRLPLPLGAKLGAVVAVIAALLALVGVLGLLALGQSNTRVKHLLELQKQTAYTQALLTDAGELSALVDERAGAFNFGQLALTGAALTTLDLTVDRSLQTFGSHFGMIDFGTRAKTPLWRWDPAVAQKLQSLIRRFYRLYGEMEAHDQGGQPVPKRTLIRAERLATAAENTLLDLNTRTSAAAAALVSQNNHSFRESRNLLLGVGAGSLGLALLLGLILAWSVVTPLRRTQERLATIAGGDFTGHVEVPNRDEIGALAADVNRMSDELGRLYGELETASRHKSDFLATMSHELRTPLNAIIGFSEVLHEQMFGELNERQLAYVNDVLEAGRHLLSLINDVLDLAKIEAGRMELELSEVALPELLRSAVSMHSEHASRGGVALALTTEPDEINIAADDRRVRQIVFNLLSNAIKFTPADGKVDVSARLDDGHVEIAVADTGPGIPPEDQETIFEEFEQGSEGKQAEGTGLGLPLSRKLVELHGGRLWVDSQAGRGSTFRFTLPVGGPAQTDLP